MRGIGIPEILHWKLDGKLVVPCKSILDWAMFWEWADRQTPSARVVGFTKVGPIEVSTVFAGIDMNWSGIFSEKPHDNPHVFETMTFGDCPDDGGFTRRYATWVDAEKGHAEAVAWAEELVKRAAYSIPDGLRLGTIPDSE